jgi:hypothetical protein
VEDVLIIRINDEGIVFDDGHRQTIVALIARAFAGINAVWIGHVRFPAPA